MEQRASPVHASSSQRPDPCFLNSLPGLRPRCPIAGCKLAPMHLAISVDLMPHTLFPTAFGTCGVAWNDTGLTGFQFPEETDTATEQRLAAKSRSQPAAEPIPEWVQALIVRMQQHLDGSRV